ncbi:DinB family protein [Maribacter sp. 4G9]|uniref:DinB family protein n=1 Tax=Maribacter sp. 4G9 TaxID=1889777 RepID=UPI000C15CE6A|nr:DinB family protein [Maribacter sp. 4G9]PIB28630.1 damage-inducible protein DinB [Maribacter sp. 4G9]
MENTIKGATQVITSNQLVEHWQGHRRLTRSVIEIFPEDELFMYSIGGMRPFADMVLELLGIAEPGLREIVTGQTAQLNEHFDHGNSKAKLLEAWDSATEQLNKLWAQMEEMDFQKQIVSFGQYPGTVQSSLFYFLDNEMHHRGQGYVYLRSLGIEPPMFYDRS